MKGGGEEDGKELEGEEVQEAMGGRLDSLRTSYMAAAKR